MPQIQILLIIGFLFIVSTLWSEFKYPITLNPDKDQTAKQAREFITHLGWLAFFLYFINTRQKIELTAKLTVGLIAAAAISALFFFVTGGGAGGAGRAAANFSMAKNSNRLAFLCVFAISLIWFYRSYAQTRSWKILTLPLLFVLPVATLATGSRGGLLQMVALAASIVKDQKGWSVAKRMYCIFAMGFVGLLMVALVPAAYIERATSFDPAADGAGQESLQNRARVVVGALQMIATDPIFGAGFGNYPWVARAYFNVERGHSQLLSMGLYLRRNRSLCLISAPVLCDLPHAETTGASRSSRAGMVGQSDKSECTSVYHLFHIHRLLAQRLFVFNRRSHCRHESSVAAPAAE